MRSPRCLNTNPNNKQVHNWIHFYTSQLFANYITFNVRPITGIRIHTTFLYIPPTCHHSSTPSPISEMVRSIVTTRRSNKFSQQQMHKTRTNRTSFHTAEDISIQIYLPHPIPQEANRSQRLVVGPPPCLVWPSSPSHKLTLLF